MKKIVSILSILILLSATVRIVYLNVNAERPVIKEFEIGTEVFYEDNYFETQDEIKNGYSLTVLSADVVKTDDFLKEHNITLPQNPYDPQNIDDASLLYVPEYVVDVVVKVKNTTNKNKQAGMDLFNTILAADDFKLEVNDNIWCELYPQLNNSKQFDLRDNTEEIIHFPYAISYSDAEAIHSVSNDMLFNTDFQLILSKYPVDLRINIPLKKSAN